MSREIDEILSELEEQNGRLQKANDLAKQFMGPAGKAAARRHDQLIIESLRVPPGQDFEIVPWTEFKLRRYSSADLFWNLMKRKVSSFVSKLTLRSKGGSK